MATPVLQQQQQLQAGGQLDNLEDGGSQVIDVEPNQLVHRHQGHGLLTLAPPV